MYRSEFFSDVQDPDEPISAYNMRCSQKALDCLLKGPHDIDISDYMLLRKLTMGLGDPALKREVFQNCVFQ